MQRFPMPATGAAPGDHSSWRQSFWLALLVLASVAFSRGFACVTPFVAFAVAAALIFNRRQGIALVLGVWLANQIVGYGFLAYPWTADSLAWGLAIGVASLLATVAARGLASAMVGLARPVVAFLAAFAIYEGALYAVALALGGTQNFSLGIDAGVFGVNAGALLGLFVLERIGVMVGLARRTSARQWLRARRAHRSMPRGQAAE